MERKKKKNKSQKIENTKSLGEINLNLSVIPININKINFPSKRQRCSCHFKNQLYILYKRHR